MRVHTSQLAQSSRELAEKKLQQQQHDVHVVSRQLEQLEEQMAVYRYLALQKQPNPPPEERYPVPTPVLLERPQRRYVKQFLDYKADEKKLEQSRQRTILILDNGGMGKIIEQLSAVCQIVVWRLEQSRQPLPEVGAQVEYLPLVEFDYDICLQHLQGLIQERSSVALILVDGLIWQTPLVVASHVGIPTVLCFEKSMNAQVLQQSWVKSRWRIQQSVLWAFDVLCIDAATIDFFIDTQCLASDQHIQVMEPDKRKPWWWLEQVQSWCQRHRTFLAQIRYLKKHDLDTEYFLGHEAWRRENTLEQQLTHFLYAWRRQISVRQLIPGFDMRCYADLNPQLTDVHPVADYLRKQCPQGPWQLPLISPGFSRHWIPRSDKVALHIHAYYIEGLPAFIHALRQNHVRPDIYISVRNEDDLEKAKQYCALYPVKVDIRIVPNRGRDIGPFLTEFGAELVDQYEIIGHMHTKQSAFHTDRDFIAIWQRFLLLNLLGNEQYKMMDEIVATLQNKPQAGMVFADDPNLADWGANWDYAMILKQQMGLEGLHLPKGVFKFPIGTMFWARAEVLKPLVQLNLTWTDYPAEPLAPDGSFLHALERMLGLLAQQVGLHNAVTYIKGVSR